MADINEDDLTGIIPSSGGSGGLTPVDQTTSLNPALNNTMYKYGTLAAPLTLTLPTGMTAFVIGVIGSATTTNKLSVVGVTDTYEFEYPNFSAVFYRAAGSTVVGVDYQAATLQGPATSATPGNVSYEGSGSFTAYLKNFAGGDIANGVVNWSRVGKLVTLTLPNTLNATSALTALSLSTSISNSVNTWPTDLTPATVSQAPIIIIQDGSQIIAAYCSLNTSGVFRIFSNGAGSAFSGTNQIKGVSVTQSITYAVN